MHALIFYPIHSEKGGKNFLVWIDENGYRKTPQLMSLTGRQFGALDILKFANQSIGNSIGLGSSNDIILIFTCDRWLGGDYVCCRKELSFQRSIYARFRSHSVFSPLPLENKIY